MNQYNEELEKIDLFEKSDENILDEDMMQKFESGMEKYRQMVSSFAVTKQESQ